jgi:hypothetical protein
LPVDQLILAINAKADVFSVYSMCPRFTRDDEPAALLVDRLGAQLRDFANPPD